MVQSLGKALVMSLPVRPASALMMGKRSWDLVFTLIGRIPQACQLQCVVLARLSSLDTASLSEFAEVCTSSTAQSIQDCILCSEEESPATFTVDLSALSQSIIDQLGKGCLLLGSPLASIVIPTPTQDAGSTQGTAPTAVSLTSTGSNTVTSSYSSTGIPTPRETNSSSSTPSGSRILIIVGGIFGGIFLLILIGFLTGIIQWIFKGRGSSPGRGAHANEHHQADNCRYKELRDFHKSTREKIVAKSNVIEVETHRNVELGSTGGSNRTAVNRREEQEVYDDPLSDLCTKNRDLIPLELENKLRAAQYLPRDDPNETTPDYWLRTYGVGGFELKRVQEAYDRSVATEPAFPNTSVNPADYPPMGDRDLPAGSITENVSVHSNVIEDPLRRTVTEHERNSGDGALRLNLTTEVK